MRSLNEMRKISLPVEIVRRIEKKDNDPTEASAGKGFFVSSKDC